MGNAQDPPGCPAAATHEAATGQGDGRKGNTEELSNAVSEAATPATSFLPTTSKQLNNDSPDGEGLCKDCRVLDLSIFVSQEDAQIPVGSRFRSPPATQCSLCQILWRSCRALRLSARGIETLDIDAAEILECQTDVLVSFNLLHTVAWIQWNVFLFKNLRGGALYLAVLPAVMAQFGGYNGG